MKKVMIIVAALMMVLVAAIPAMAQTFEFDQEATSGDVVQVYESNTAGWGNAVANDVSFDANTGNYQSQESYNLSGNVQYDN